MDDVMLLATTAGVLLVLGAFAGVLAGLLGVGGGIILVPAFFYAFSALGFDSPQLMQVCLGTSLATIIVTSLRSVLAHNKWWATLLPACTSLPSANLVLATSCGWVHCFLLAGWKAV